jgi:hypothetical protein
MTTADFIQKMTSLVTENQRAESTGCDGQEKGIAWMLSKRSKHQLCCTKISIFTKGSKILSLSLMGLDRDYDRKVSCEYFLFSFENF